MWLDDFQYYFSPSGSPLSRTCTRGLPYDMWFPLAPRQNHLQKNKAASHFHEDSDVEATPPFPQQQLNKQWQSQWVITKYLIDHYGWPKQSEDNLSSSDYFSSDCLVQYHFLDIMWYLIEYINCSPDLSTCPYTPAKPVMIILKNVTSVCSWVIGNETFSLPFLHKLRLQKWF